jgi:hypothetical protein
VSATVITLLTAAAVAPSTAPADLAINDTAVATALAGCTIAGATGPRHVSAILGEITLGLLAAWQPRGLAT